MRNATEHYEQHLARVYAWSVGGAAEAVARADRELAELGLLDGKGAALDLGAGFGAHAIPLARAGWRVDAVDASFALLEELRARAVALGVSTHQADIIEFAERTETSYDMVVCLGDTLPHLETIDDVDRLLAAATRRLNPGGRLVLAFRDHAAAPAGSRAFIPVRGDEDRSMTCVLEYEVDRVAVHDLLHERGDGGWGLSVSSSPKLRLSPDAILRRVEALGCRAEPRSPLRGLHWIVASRT